MVRYFAGLGAASALLIGVAAISPSPAADAAPVASAPAAQPAPQVQSGNYSLDKAHAKILWTVSHFGFSEYTGEFTDFDARLALDAANPERSSLTVTVATPSIATHDDALDKHLKAADFFDVEKHPTATFTSTAIEHSGASTARVSGNFTMLGRTLPLTLDVSFNKAGENMAGVYTVGFSASGTVKRSAYGMTYAVPGVSDEVALRISGEFNPAS